MAKAMPWLRIFFEQLKSRVTYLILVYYNFSKIIWVSSDNFSTGLKKNIRVFCKNILQIAKKKRPLKGRFVNF